MADQKISALTAATTPLAGTEVLPIVQSGATKNVSINNLTAGKAVSIGTLTVTGASALDDDVTLADGASNTSPVIIIKDQNSTSGLNINTAYGSGYINMVDAKFLRMGTNNATQLEVNNSGDLKVITGNLVIGTSGKGIDFSATSHAAGMTSELLNDYEEGTWTPTAVAGLGGAYGGSGLYTKIGRAVYCYGTINVTDITGNITIGGLPFTSSSFPAAMTAGLSYIGPVTLNYGGVGQSTTEAFLNVTGTYSGGALSIYFSFWYFV
jgi:hypothetical protein